MSRKHHELKTETQWYQAVESGLKTFEVRKNDRNFKLGDCLNLVEVVQGIYTGRKLEPLEVVYILPGGAFGLHEDYCILGFVRSMRYECPIIAQ